MLDCNPAMATKNRNTFWKPSDAGDNNILEDDNDGTTVHINYPLERQILPITAHRTQILYALEEYGVLILVGETG